MNIQIEFNEDQMATVMDAVISFQAPWFVTNPIVEKIRLASVAAVKKSNESTPHHLNEKPATPVKRGPGRPRKVKA